jgi:hypothetical protein
MRAPRFAASAPRFAHAAPRFAAIAPRFAHAAPRFAAIALASAAIAPGIAQAAPPDADQPAGAAAFVATSAENGTPSDLEAVLDLRETGPDGGVPRCLGAGSFERTAWAWIEAAEQPRRIVVEATAQSGATAIPDLALFPQQPVTRSTADVREPAACDGRESLGGIARTAGAAAAPIATAAAESLGADRGDGSSAVVAVLRAGRPALVQVGWRAGDGDAPVVVSLAAQPLEKRPAPPGDDPADAPALALGATTAVALGGATLGLGDPAQPACPAPATVWRRVTLPSAGVYAVTAGAAARTLTAFADPLGGDSALACADLADTPELKLTPRVAAAGPLWIRIGADQLDGDPQAQLHVSGPYADERAAEAAPVPPPGGGSGPSGTGPRGSGTGALACVRARAPRLAISAASLRALRRGSGRTLSGTVRQPCDRRRPRAVRVTVAIGRAGRRARLGRALPARGVARWRRTLPRRLAPGRHLFVVRAVARAPRGRRARAVATVRRTLVVAARSTRGTKRPNPTKRPAGTRGPSRSTPTERASRR